ncbi:primosomal protein DnaI [Ligilactobacillus apodemi]|uniref:Primosomal protein DnaI n=1 Tax=Ligilactobacillus apodemi DSM 16634 = JCM 16172 TaxID=1423724 RepID=A0A0R1TQ92_9LACO|nr:primosomal protein DnaI [Ligilactobacillus apodemi]KRL83629.1 primosomal protein DnaI [Ligilactobacillus apodemi DSM 16634 = JCM 16172]MBD5069551.1 primosomal protein DnaI [Lactobacillus sp.]MCR1900480.1 primosomal protein DnaI [Ligilactobacillus apodemi]
MEDLGKNLQKKMTDNNWNQRYQELITESLKDEEVRTFLAENNDVLTQADIMKSASKLYEFVTLKKQLAQGKQIFAPGYLPTLTVSNHRIEVVYVPTAELIAQREQKALERRVKTINLPRSVRKAQLKDYDRSDERMEALKAAMAFIASYTKDPKTFHKGLYLEGSFGVGKTYLLAAIANELASKGYETTLVHFPSFAVEIKGSIGQNKSNEYIERLKKAPVLMIDDIGADSLSSWLRDDVLGVILQYRMQEELPTFFSSNFSLEQLEKQYLTVNNRGEAEPLKAKRIMERIKFLATQYHVVGKNRRNP